MSSLKRELELEREFELRRARNNFLAFVQHTMPNYEVNWHHKVIADALEKVAKGQTKRLVVTTPPRHGKSQLVSMHLPAFVLGINPKAQIIAASYNATLAAKMNRSVQRIIDSPLYQEVFPSTELSASNIRTVASGNWLRNSDEFEVVGHGGIYRSAGVGGSATGYGMTLGICDDPTRNRQDASSPTYQQRLMDWFQSTFFTRLEKNGALIIVLTRWSERDLVGQLLDIAKNDPMADQWDVLNLPAIAETERHIEDPREIGEALWVQKYDVKRLAKIRATIGEREWVSLYQQRPAPAEGALIKMGWIQRCKTLPTDLTEYTLSVDLTFGNTGDYAAFGVFARKGPNHYCVEMVEQRLDFNEQIAMFRALSGKYPQMQVKIVENAANGAALIASLKQQIPGIIAYSPRTSKELRVQAVSPMFEAGNFWVPQTPWADRYITQLCTFPSAAHDDMVDATTGYLLRVQQKAYDFSNFRAVGLKREEPKPWR